MMNWGTYSKNDRRSIMIPFISEQLLNCELLSDSGRMITTADSVCRFSREIFIKFKSI